jgi:glycosyltransferase involved in cell wall biosynthesis
MAASRKLLAAQVNWARWRLGIERPLVWITCPAGMEVLDQVDPAAVVYERTDRWECFPDADAEAMSGYHRELRARADLILYCSDVLFADEREGSDAAEYVDHGVDFERFAAAGAGPASEPRDLMAIPHPRVGFIGGIDAHTFDPDLFQEVARRLADCQFVLVGDCSLPSGWCRQPNVHLLGRRPFDQIDRYMAACDVLIMPWAQNRWIEACNPVKLKEYLAVGRPVVSTPFPQLDRFPGLVEIARGAEDFALAIERVIHAPGDAEARRARVRNETWSAKGDLVLDSLARRGVRCARR